MLKDRGGALKKKGGGEKTGKNNFTRKLCAGFVLFIMVMSVFSGAISATDMNTSDLPIDESSMMQNEGFDEGKDSKPLSYALPQTRVGVLSYSYESDLLKITVGEQSSSGWHYQYDPVGDPENFIRSVYGEHYAVATDTWGSVIRSSSFIIDTSFGSEEAPDTATLHYGNLSLTRQVTPPEGSARSFSIIFVLTNTGDSTMENVRFFQGVDYDIKDSGNDYAWYTEATDTVWQNDDSYFKNGFHGSRPSSHHDCNRYGSMWSDMHSGQLNDLPKYPEAEGETKDCGIAMQWDAGDLLPQASWDLTITFYFGEAAGIEANVGPDQTVGRGQPVTFDASRSSSVSTITTYEWDFDNDGVYEVSVSSPIYEYEGWTELGEYIVGLRVTDDEGRTDTDTMKVTVVPNVDLTITNITFTPTEINDGDIVIFNATVKNNGTDAITDDFYVRFEIDGNYIGRQQVSGGLSAGESVHAIQNWHADIGTHTLKVVADYYDEISESNETNNKLVKSLPEILSPDLSVTDIEWIPSDINDGNTVTFNATVNNIGGSTTRDFYVRFEVDSEYIGRKLVSGLSDGANTIVVQNWLARAGLHNVTVYVDEYNAITESDETNNKMTEDLPFIQFPDLTVTNISWMPTDIVGGDTVTFTATVKNIGAGNTSTDFYVRFEVGGKYIGRAKVSDGLDSGNLTKVTQTWTATWANTVNVSVDEYDTVVESDENNNNMSKNLPGLPFPDLIVTDLTWEPKEKINAGDPITFTATIENTGGTFYSTMSNPLKIAFLVNDEYAGSRNIVGGIRAGQPLTTTFTWTAQPGTNPTVCVKADYSDIIPESNEDNNELCETLALAIKSPDLTITQLTFEPTGSIHVGDTVKFTAKVENVGEGNYSGDFDIGFHVNDTFAGVSHVVNGVAAGKNTFSTFNWTASSCSNPVIKAKVDFFDVVRESYEDNNERTEVLPASVPYADLEITDINWTPHENIKDRAPVIFNVTVKNNGPENVVTDFKVYFEIDGYFTRTNLISGGLAADESRSISFTWKATPGDGHTATAKADSDNVVPESDRTNNEWIQLLPFDVSLVEIFEVWVEPAETTTGIGGRTSCKIKINNHGSASANFDISVAGLNPGWVILSEPSIFLSAGEEGIVDLDISVPEACENSGTFPFNVSVTSQETGITKQGPATLIVEPTPVIHDLLPKDGASSGSDDVTFSWNTYINASPTIYLKAEDEVDYTSYTDTEGQIHTVVVSNLARNKNYSYYAESSASCGSYNSPVRTFYIGNGISFSKDVYEFTVERDYDQRVTIRVQNTDNEYHELLVEVPITYDDLVLGFVGDGSQDNIIPLNPGKSKDVTLAIQCADALKEDYELMANLTSTKGDEILTDTARIKISVHVPRIDYDLEEISVDPVTLTKTFKLTNKGDPITDLTLSAAENLKENVYIEPAIDHFRLDEGASIEFNVVPLLSSHDFQASSEVASALSGVKAAGSPGVSGDLLVTIGGVTVVESLNFAIPVGKNVYPVEVPNVIWEKHINTWFCNNRPNIEIWWEMVTGIQKDKVILDPLIIKFDSRGGVKPHDLYITVNGHEIGSLINTVPEGYYKFDVDPSFLIYPERGVSRNCIEIHTVHQNGGHYIVGSDMEVHLDLRDYTTHLVASSQEEANQTALDNLPPGFYKAPDSITIEEGTVSQLEESTLLTSSTTEVLLGKPTTLQATTSPNLLVWAEFSNGDGAVYLAEVGSGMYRGTWTPRNYPEPNGICVITIKAKGPGPGDGDLIQGQIQRTVKIIKATKLNIKINEPEDGKKISQIEGFTKYYYGVQPVRVTVTDDAGSEIKSSDVQISGWVVITEDKLTKAAQQLSNWVDEGNGNFRCDWTPECPGEYEIEVKAVDLSPLSRKNAKASVTGTLEEAELKITNVKGPSGTIDPYWDYTRDPKKVFDPHKPDHYSHNFYNKYPDDFKITFTINKKAKIKREVYSKGPDDWVYHLDSAKSYDLGTFDKGDNSFSIGNVIAYGDDDYRYYVKIIAEAVEGEAKDSDDSVAFSIERKPYFKVDKKAQYINIEEPSILSLAWFLGKPVLALFVGDLHAFAPIIWHVCIDPGVSSKDYEKITLVERWWIDEYNWGNEEDRYLLHHWPNKKPWREPVAPQTTALIYPSPGALCVESRTYYLEKRTKYYEMMPSEDNEMWWTYEGVKLVNEAGTWRLAKAGQDLSIYTKILVLAVQGGIEIADKVEVGDPKVVTEFVPQETEIKIYRPVYNPYWRNKECRIITYSLKSYEGKYGPRPKPAMNYNQIMNPTKKSHTSHDILIDDAVSEATFYVCWDSTSLNKTVKLTIEDPQGEIIDPVSANANTDVEYLTYTTSSPDAEHQIIDELYRVKNPVAGNWKMNVSSLGAEPAEYYICAFADSEISLSFYTDKQVYGPDEQMTLEARLLYRDEPVTGANVTAEIQRPDGIKESVTLFDDGAHNDYQVDDGIYSNVYANLNIEGEYWLNTNASGSTEKGEFRRATSVKKFVQDRPLVFIDNPQDAETIGGVANISVSAVDNSGIISSYEIWLNDVKVSNSNSYTWNTFSADGLYRIIGKATDAEGNTGTDEITVTVLNIPDPSDTVAPSTPTGVTISVVETGNALKLNWDASVEDDLAGYYIYRSNVNGGPYSKINLDPIKETVCTDDGVYDEGLSGNRMYYYVITAVDENELESVFSQEVSRKPLGSWVETFDNDLYINTSLSHNVIVADGKLTLSEGSTDGYAISKAIKPDLKSWKNVYWLERTYGQITSMKISQDGVFWQIVSNGSDISNLDVAKPVFYKYTMESDGVNISVLYEILFTFTMGQEPIGFTSVFSDEGTDEDSDGLYDYLTISIGVDIESPRYYYLTGDLKDKDENILFGAHRCLYYLKEGKQTVKLKFEGETIYQHGVNGPYTLTNLELQDVNYRQIDLLSEAYNTLSYTYTDFERPPAEFNDNYSDQGTDTDGDGLYNTLTVNTGINVSTAGNYMVIGTLEDNAGHEISSASNSSQLEAGSYTMSLEFSGISIRKQGVDGPYYLRNLTLFYQSEASRQIGYRSEAYTTNAYNNTDFQKPPVAFTGSFSDRGTDTDSDGKYDYLTIDIEVHVENEGEYNISGRLEDVNGSEIVIATSTVNIVDTQTIQLNFNGLIISGHRMNGPYKIKDLLIYNVEDGSQFDFLSDAYTTTSEYNYSDFQAPPLDLTLSPTDIIFSNDAPEGGEQITISATIHNDGTVDANGVVVQFWEGNPTIGGNPLGSDQTITSIEAGGTGIAQVSWNAIYGSHDLYIVVDPANNVVESDETNNIASKSITVVSQPDLTLSEEDISFDPAYPSEGTLVNISAAIHNIGGSDASSVVVQFFDGTPASGGTQIGSDQKITSIEAGGTGNTQVTWTAIRGTHDIFVQVDPYNSISETSENNNQAFRRITVSGVALPDLTITSEDIQFIPPASNSGSLSSPVQTPHTKNMHKARAAVKSIEDVKSARPHKEIIPRGLIKDDEVTSSSDTQRFTIEYITIPSTVNPDKTFQVTVYTSYSLSATTDIFAGIWDYDAWEYIAETPDDETLSGTGSKSYTFYLTAAPSSGIMHLSADLWYYDFDEGWWILLDYSDFDVNVAGKGKIATISATIHNIGTADASNTVVQFFDGDPNAGGVQIGSDQTISSIPAGGTGSAQVTWTAIPGTHDIFVRIDPYNSIQEANENNNQAYKPITVGEKTIHVDDDFTDDPANHRWNTIQEAINDVNDGDTVLVYPGTYYENVFLNKTLTLIGEGLPTIDAQGSGDAITITADDCTVKGFNCVNAYSSPYAGICVESNNNVIEDNTCKNNGFGIILLTTSENIIANNTAKNNEKNGIYLQDSNNNRITDNDASNNSYNGISLESSDNNEIRNNNANYNLHQGIRFGTSSENIIANNAAKNNDEYGIALWTSDENIIANNIAKNNGGVGILLSASNNNKITDNDASNTVKYDGIALFSSNNNEIANNTVNSNNFDGIRLYSHSNNNILTNNIANSNREAGILCWTSSENILTYNNLGSNDYGIRLYNYSTDNILANNTATLNSYGISVIRSSNNNIYLNDFIDNTDNAYSYNSNNIWHSTSRITYTYNGNTYIKYLGNYWSDYNGSDADGDGIGEDPYSIEGDKDYYPLMERFENLA